MSSGLWADLIGGSKGSEKISIPSSLDERSWEKIYEDKNCRGVKLYKNFSKQHHQIQMIKHKPIEKYIGNHRLCKISESMVKVIKKFLYFVFRI